TDGAAISGTTMLIAEPIDDLGIASVVFTVAYGQQLVVRQAPWQVEWDATEIPDGNYVITAQAFDLADNPSAQVSVAVVKQEEPNSSSGGCCQTGNAGAPAALLWMAVVGLLLRRRRRAVRLSDK
ncbi:MAG TPA: Ig-like domain-containing protein, partial [Kofleriaceae bacterium]